MCIIKVSRIWVYLRSELRAGGLARALVESDVMSIGFDIKTELEEKEGVE